MSLTSYATETNVGEAQATVALLDVDIAEGALPTAIAREADSMPDNVTPGNTTGWCIMQSFP
jgi:predicted RNA polymerase sigma factor